MELKYIIFDFDGTLYKMICDWENMKNNVLNYFPKKKRNVTPRYVYEHVDLWVKKKPKVKEKVLKYIERFEIRTVKSKESYWIFDSKNIIKNLKKKGFEIAIVSNNTKKAIDYALKKANMAKYISFVIDREQIAGKPKPNPAPILLAIKKFGAKKNECLYVGDHKTDAIAAKAARIKCIIVNDSFKTRGVINIRNINKLEKKIENIK